MEHASTTGKRLAVAIAALLCATTFQAFSQSKKENNEKEKMVKIKITKIIDGDTTVVEKMVPESEVATAAAVAKDAKGKNVQVIVIAGDDKDGKKKEKQAYSYSYNYNNTGSPGKTRKVIVEKDDRKSGTVDIDIDSIMKNIKLSFDFNFDSITKQAMGNFNFDTEDFGAFGDVVIINNDQQTRVSANGGKTVVKKIEKSGDDDSKNVTVIVSSDGKEKKKVIIKTTVRVEDAEGEAAGKKGDDLKLESFSFFPNPTEGKFNLEFKSYGKEPSTVSIVDITGKEVYKETFKGEGKHKKEIDLGQKKGTFILNLQQGNRSISRKIIVE